MKRIMILLISATALVMSQMAFAGDFCAGFEEGYKAIKGDMVMVPMCPMAPMTPMGSTDFREGLKAGMRAAGG